MGRKSGGAHKLKKIVRALYTNNEPNLNQMLREYNGTPQTNPGRSFPNRGR